MKQYHLYLTLRIDVDSCLKTLSDTVQEFEQHTVYSFSDTQNVRIIATEILKTEPFNPDRDRL